MRKLDAPWCCSEHRQSGCPRFMDERDRWISNTSRWKAVSERGHFNQEKVHINDAEGIYELGHKHSFSECLLGPKANFSPAPSSVLQIPLGCLSITMNVTEECRWATREFSGERNGCTETRERGALCVRVHRSLEFRRTPNLNPRPGGGGDTWKETFFSPSEILISTFPGLKYSKLV